MLKGVWYGRLPYMIEPAEPNDVEEIMALIGSVINKMQREGIDQWDCLYPSLNIIENDIIAGSLYKYTVNSMIEGIIVLNDLASPEYDSIGWHDKSGEYLVVHRLAVYPDFQGRGIAKELMDFCEKLAVIKNKRSIRLDAFTKNETACNLYRKLNYIERGIVKFRKGDFYCLEKEFYNKSGRPL